MAIDTRHRDKTGEISRKHGNTLIRTLRKTYGESFAGSCGNKKKLDDVLNKLDEPSLTRLIHDQLRTQLAGWALLISTHVVA
jgi:hypothetical protein